MTHRNPPLKFLHTEETLVSSKLAVFNRLSTDEIVSSLAPGQPSCLKTRPDGTIIDGHHRIQILRKREVAVDDLPRQVIPKEESQ